MKNNLPIKASLTTRDGFHKCIDIQKLEHILYIPRRSKLDLSTIMDISLVLNSASMEQLEFYLERYREVKQKNGLRHIVAVYKEI